ncbi:HAD family hydrolase [Clostridioides difficile]|uniref:hypothetical protein n=1 Tax=Clostridioides difficile TaxID=1496 RepID=UPI0008A45849|nr:hypothetical protein [Clostridioides difficile]OFU33353.1 hypothetical protein HMPREF3075_05525 [Clostridium sp. HMSC19B11]EGT4052810.1 hypothetical protein [Clostridioides difficile]EGT5448941.1 hypothetical protein [Clostridioides difficile]MBF4710575.1 hypothetical protein [Clostridioides difficile]MBY1443955.1 HAD family hydrolase [Clostridioides difficile]
MIKFTKEQIKKDINEVLNNYDGMYECGYYIKDSELNFFINYTGQGMDSNLYNKSYDTITYIQDYIKEYKAKFYNMKDIQENIYENVKEMIEEL